MRKVALVLMAGLVAAGQFLVTYEASARPGGGGGRGGGGGGGGGFSRGGGGGGGGGFRGGGGGGAFRGGGGGGAVFRGGGGGFRSFSAPAFRPAFRSAGPAFRPAFRGAPAVRRGPVFRGARIARGGGIYRGRGFYRNRYRSYRPALRYYPSYSCYRIRRVFTPYGYRLRRVNVCRPRPFFLRRNLLRYFRY